MRVHGRDAVRTRRSPLLSLGVLLACALVHGDLRWGLVVPHLRCSIFRGVMKWGEAHRKVSGDAAFVRWFSILWGVAEVQRGFTILTVKMWHAQHHAFPYIFWSVLGWISKLHGLL